MNLNNLKQKYSLPKLQKVNNKLNIKGNYYIKSVTGLLKESGEISIPINDIIDVSQFKYRNVKCRNKMIVFGLINILYDKAFGNIILDLMDIWILDFMQFVLLVVWGYFLIKYIATRHSFLEIITVNKRYCLHRKSIELEELKTLVEIK